MSDPRKPHYITDLRSRPTLGYALFAAWQKVAPRYGARLEGLEDDANEHSDFWQQVAAQILEDNP